MKSAKETLSNDKHRDYTSKIEDIIERSRPPRKRARRGAPGCARRRRRAALLHVTTHGIERRRRAIKNAKLDGSSGSQIESWTSERLRVMILDRVLADFRPCSRETIAAWRRWKRSIRSLQARRRGKLSAHLRDFGASCGQQELRAVHAAALPDPWRSGDRRPAREHRTKY